MLEVDRSDNGNDQSNASEDIKGNSYEDSQLPMCEDEHDMSLVSDIVFEMSKDEAAHDEE